MHFDVIEETTRGNEEKKGKKEWFAPPLQSKCYLII